MKIFFLWILLLALPNHAEEFPDDGPTDVHANYYDRLLGKTLKLSKKNTFQQFLNHYQRGIVNFAPDEIAYFVSMQNAMQKCMHLLDNKKRKKELEYSFDRANDFYLQLVRPMYKNTVAKGNLFAYGTEPRTAQTFANKYPSCAEFFEPAEKIPETFPNFFAEHIFYPAKEPTVTNHQRTKSDLKTAALITNYLQAFPDEKASLKKQFWLNIRVRSLDKGKDFADFKSDTMNQYYDWENLLLADAKKSLTDKAPYKSPQRFILQSFMILRGVKTLSDIENDKIFISAASKGLTPEGKPLSQASLEARQNKLVRIKSELDELLTPIEKLKPQ